MKGPLSLKHSENLHFASLKGLFSSSDQRVQHSQIFSRDCDKITSPNIERTTINSWKFKVRSMVVTN